MLLSDYFIGSAANIGAKVKAWIFKKKVVRSSQFWNFAESEKELIFIRALHRTADFIFFFLI